jgi:hypothetical protein
LAEWGSSLHGARPDPASLIDGKEQLRAARQDGRAAKVHEGPLAHRLAGDQGSMDSQRIAPARSLRGEGQVDLIGVSGRDMAMDRRDRFVVTIAGPERAGRPDRDTGVVGPWRHGARLVEDAHQGQRHLASRRHQVPQPWRQRMAQFMGQIARDPMTRRTGGLDPRQGFLNLLGFVGADQVQRVRE